MPCHEPDVREKWSINMAALTVFKRYEKKYIMNKVIMDRLLPEIMAHMEGDAYCRDGKTYSISNLYFDTDGYDVIRESLSKPFYKEKLRLRSYGVPSSPQDPVFLEMKKKVNSMVTKRRAKLTAGEAERFLTEGEFPQNASYMTSQVLREIDYYLSHKDVRPVMRLSYERMAFFDREDPDFRLTFDMDMRYIRGAVGIYDQDKGRLLLPEDARLMEVKVTNAYPLWFSRLLSEENVHITSFSKYGVAYKTYLKEQVLKGRKQVNILGRI